MSIVINGLARGEFLNLPGVRTAALVGTTSTVMAVGLNAMGFPYSSNVVTAAFTVAGVGGLAVTAIGAVAYSVLAIGMQVGNDRALRGY